MWENWSITCCRWCRRTRPFTYPASLQPPTRTPGACCYRESTAASEIDTNSNAAYHSLEASLSRRFSSGLTFLASYTFGKLLDYYSAQNLGQTPQDPCNERADRSRSDEDRNHVFTSSFVYELPLLRGKGWKSTAFGNWS